MRWRGAELVIIITGMFHTYLLSGEGHPTSHLAPEGEV